MKRKLLFFMLAFLMSTQGLFANQADEFYFDIQKFQDECADLIALEEDVILNNYMSLSEMQNKNLLSPKFSSLNLSGSIMIEPALGIPGFWWGCVLGPIGILIAYVVAENDKHEAKQALFGCIVSYGVGCVAYVVFYIWIFENSWIWL